MRDEQRREPHLALQGVAHEIDDLRPDPDVERTGRLIRRPRKPAASHSARAMPTRFCRPRSKIRAEGPSRAASERRTRSSISRTRACRSAGLPHVRVKTKRLGHQLPDRPARVEGDIRLLGRPSGYPGAEVGSPFLTPRECRVRETAPRHCSRPADGARHWPTVVLPDPLSPTRASVSPDGIRKETSSTARTTSPDRVVKVLTAISRLRRAVSSLGHLGLAHRHGSGPGSGEQFHAVFRPRSPQEVPCGPLLDDLPLVHDLRRDHSSGRAMPRSCVMITAPRAQVRGTAQQAGPAPEPKSVASSPRVSASSARMTFGSVINAIAMTTRCAMPPESSCG